MSYLFKSEYGPGGDVLLDALLKVHDSVGNAYKRRWALRAKAAEDAVADGEEANLEMLAQALVDAAKERLNDMVAAVEGGGELLTHDQARTAVLETEVGQTLQDIHDAAERVASEASQISKRVETSLAKKDAERRLFDRAREIQVEKARKGRPLSLLEAVEIAKTEKADE